ncbi:MAG: hypothetical protein IJA97_06415 [Clostridia bacterium]|nr:hypothetical protein [Clostridia bacterium]
MDKITIIAENQRRTIKHEYETYIKNMGEIYALIAKFYIEQKTYTKLIKVIFNKTVIIKLDK